MFLAEIDDLRALLFWLVFLILPLLGRLMGWISTKRASAETKSLVATPERGRGGSPPTRDALLELDSIEPEGVVAPERPPLASFLEDEPPQPPAASPRDVAQPAPSRTLDAGKSSLAPAFEPSTFDSASWGAALDVRPEVPPEGSIGDATERAFGALGGLGELRGRAKPEPDAYRIRRATRGHWARDRDAVRRAILWREIIGPPVSLRGSDGL